MVTLVGTVSIIAENNKVTVIKENVVGVCWAAYSKWRNGGD